MRYFLLFLVFFTYLFSCSGDCISCHPTLEKSIKKSFHKDLSSCVICHNKLSSSMSQCGGDCFSCHSQNKLIKSDTLQHQNLALCKQCHISKEDFLSYPNSKNTLIDLLKNK